MECLDWIEAQDLAKGRGIGTDPTSKLQDMVRCRVSGDDVALVVEHEQAITHVIDHLLVAAP